MILSSEINDIVENDRDTIIYELSQFLKSDSSIGKDCSLYLQQYLKKENYDIVELFGYDNPIVYAEKKCGLDDAFTLLVYGHYDVQDTGNLKKWKYDPFSPYVSESRIYARGASDDKGQVFCYLKALEYFTQKNALSFNIKVVLDGEEEKGSQQLIRLIENRKEIFSCDAMFISDNMMIESDRPSLCSSARGFIMINLKSFRKGKECHSGTFGGIVKNPVNVNAKILVQINEYLEICNFNCKLKEDVIKRIKFEDIKCDCFGISDPEKAWYYNSMDCHSFIAGDGKENFITNIPCESKMVFSIRTAPDMDIDLIKNKVKEIIDSNICDGINITYDFIGSAVPFSLKGADSSCNMINMIKKSFNKYFKKEMIEIGEGGGMPVIGKIHKKIGCRIYVIGLGEKDDNIHTYNESFKIENLLNGIKSIWDFFEYFNTKTAE